MRHKTKGIKQGYYDTTVKDDEEDGEEEEEEEEVMLIFTLTRWIVQYLLLRLCVYLD